MPYDDALILSQYESGRSATDIANEIGCSRRTINRIVNRYRGSHRSISEQCSKYHINRDYFDTISPESVYWLGFIAADGRVLFKRRKNGHLDRKLIIRLSISDGEHLFRLKSALSSSHKVRYEPKTKSIRLTINNTRLIHSLISAGILQFKSGKWISFASMQGHFIRGLIDGDGWVSKSKRGRIYIGFCSPHRKHVFEVRKFLGYRTKIEFRKGVWRFSKDITNQRDSCKQLSTHCVRLDRKWEKID